MKTITLTAPSHWANYLINGDDSNLDIQDVIDVEAWLDDNDIDPPVSCEDVGFLKRHDALLFALACDCHEYTFLI